MDVQQITVIFVLFSVIWIVTNIIWKIIEGRIMLKQQNTRLDALYSKIVRLVGQTISDIKKTKRGENGD